VKRLFVLFALVLSASALAQEEGSSFLDPEEKREEQVDPSAAQTPSPAPTSIASLAPAPSLTLDVPFLSPTPSPSGSPLTIPSSSEGGTLGHLEILELQSMLAESEFLRDKTIEARSDLVNIYEQMVGPTCMPDLLSELSFSGMRGNRKCGELLDKLLELDQMNPMALCARDGIDSRSCRNAFAKTQFDTYSPEAMTTTGTGQNGLDLEAKLASSRNAPMIEKLEGILYNINFMSNGKFSDEQKQKVRQTYAKLLTLTCFFPKLRLEPLAGGTGAAPSAPDKGLLGEESGFENPGILGETHGDAPNERFQAGPNLFKRTRLLAGKCAHYINESLVLFPDFSPATCQKWGYYSPLCVDAKRRDRSKKRAEAPKAPSAPEGNKNTNNGFVQF
jgi:hypothetical protein